MSIDDKCQHAVIKLASKWEVEPKYGRGFDLYHCLICNSHVSMHGKYAKVGDSEIYVRTRQRSDEQ
jgi:hypothetical protein